MPAPSAITLVLRRVGARLRSLVASPTRRPAFREGSALPAAIKACRADLLAFGQTSDREFSALAQGLSQLNARLAELRTQTASLDAVLQDRDEDRAISSAYALYKNSVDLVHANAGIAVSVQERLSQVEAALSQSCRGRGSFERDHFFLRIVTLGVRMEASRLATDEQTVFLNVASAISKAGEQIETCTAGAFGRIEEVIAESRAARGAMKEIERVLQDEARQSIDLIQSEISTLQRALAPCAEQSRAIGNLLAAAQPQTLAVIGALQHQDIVRQQLEHVGESFQDLQDHLYPAARGRGPAPQIEWDYVHQAAHIQTAQLAGSRTEIEQAGAAVLAGLRKLLDTSAGMVERFLSMEAAAATALDQCRIAELFSRELQKLTRIIDQSEQANVRTALLVDRIEEIVRLFSEEIGRYELDVKIVALNAQIAAARLSSGDALSKLAEKTNEVSDTNARVSRQLSTDLQANLQQLNQMKSETAAFLAIVAREKTSLEAGSDEVGKKLTRLVEAVRSGSTEMRRAFEPVHADCRALLDNVGFPELIEDTFAPATRLCDDLAAMSLSFTSHTGPSETALVKIREHQSRYTMQKEDAVHTAALGRAPATAPAAMTGEDIELFDLPAATAEDSRLPAPQPATPAFVANPGAPVLAASTPAQNLGDGIELF